MRALAYPAAGVAEDFFVVPLSFCLDGPRGEGNDERRQAPRGQAETPAVGVDVRSAIPSLALSSSSFFCFQAQFRFFCLEKS